MKKAYIVPIEAEIKVEMRKGFLTAMSVQWSDELGEEEYVKEQITDINLWDEVW